MLESNLAAKTNPVDKVTRKANAYRQSSTVKRKQRGQKGDLIQVFIDWVLIVGEPVFPWDTWPRVAGLLDPFDSCFLELHQLLQVEARPVKGADASGGPVLAEAIDTLDGSCFGIVFGDGHVGT